MRQETIKIVYHTDKIDKLTYIDGKSDWIDLRAAEDVEFHAGEFKLINLGVSMQKKEVVFTEFREGAGFCADEDAYGASKRGVQYAAQLGNNPLKSLRALMGVPGRNEAEDQ